MTQWSISALIAGDARTPDEMREAVYLSAGDARVKHSRFWLLLALATGIATAGIVSDSTATVIGAMIIAPLATPIQGIALAIALGEIRPLLSSAATLLGAVLVAIGIAVALAWALPQLEPLRNNAQITGRTAPTVVDLVAAALTGLTGSIAITRRDIGDVLPGVAIAISLVPPLAVVGVTALFGDWSGALGALLLFLTNVLAIIVVGVMVFGGVAARAALSGPALRPAYAVVGLLAVGVTAALGVTTYHAVEVSDWQQSAKQIGATWATDHGEQFVAARFDGDTLVMLVQGHTNGSEDQLLPDLLRGTVPAGTPVVVERISGGLHRVGKVQR